MRKESKRKKQSCRYRGAHKTLQEKLSKKLLEATTWYKDGEERGQDEDSIKENKYKDGRSEKVKGWKEEKKGRKL